MLRPCTPTAWGSSTNRRSLPHRLKDLTYARIGELARAQAAALDEMGIAPGERVAIASHNSARLLTSFFGVSGFGRVLVPINFRLSTDEIAYIVKDSGASALLVDPGPG